MLLSLAVVLAAVPSSPCEQCEVFASPKAAFTKVLALNPTVLAIGEYHEMEGAPKVKSALKRFTLELLPSLKARAGALIAETWMTTGTCGAVEKQATQEVQKVTKRPDTTEDELTTMLHKAFDTGFKNHILTLNCDEYASLLDTNGELDAIKSLLLVKHKVEEKADEAIEKEEAVTNGKLLVLYGGALHNDLTPTEDMAPYSFGPSLSQSLDGGYVELDLLVPEYVKADPDLRKEPWFASVLATVAKGKTVVVWPNPKSALLFFPQTAKPKKK